MQTIDFFERFEPGHVENIVEIDGQSTMIRMAVFSTDSMEEGFSASFSAIRNEIVEDGRQFTCNGGDFAFEMSPESARWLRSWLENKGVPTDAFR